MGRIVLTLDTDMFSSGADSFEQLVRDIQAFINILHNVSPDYYEAGLQLQQQLDDQVKQHDIDTKEADPKEQMQKYLDAVCPLSIEQDTASSGFWQCYDKLRSSIGEAMGPVTYAAYRLARYIEAQDLPAYKKEHDFGTDWVWSFVKYYEENWKF